MSRFCLETLVQTHQREILCYLRYMGADSHVAEDLAQETFVVAWEHKSPPPAEQEHRCRGWLRGIARNLFLTHCRKVKRSPVMVNSETVNLAEDVWAEVLPAEEGWMVLASRLNECLSGLSDRNRQLVADRYENNRSRADMASAHSLSEDGVKTALRRIRESLLKCIQAGSRA